MISIDFSSREQDLGFNRQNLPSPYGMKEIQIIEQQLMHETSGVGGSASSKKNLSTENTAKVLIQKKQQRAMGLAMSPGKNMVMNAFMLFMSGKSLNIFSISVTGQAIMTPLKVSRRI